MTGREKELAFRLADSFAKSEVDSFSIAMHDGWKNISFQDESKEITNEIADAAEYLELRGMLVHHKTKKYWVKIKNQKKVKNNG